MALVLNDRVKETSTTTGQGTLSLAGAATGFETFVTGIGDGNTTYYLAAHESDGTWELGIGTITDASPDTLARTTVIDTSAGNTTKIDFASGSKTIFCTLPAGKAVFLDADGDVTLGANLSVGGNLDVTGTFDLSDSNFTNAGDIQLDSITGDGDTNTKITFSGSDVNTVTAGGDNQVTFTNGAIVPSTDNDIDLGTSSVEFKDAFFDGTVTSDAFAGPLTGNVTGNVSGTAATVTGAAQSNITSLGTLTTLTVDNVIINGTTIGHTDDTDLMTVADGVLTVAGEVSMTTLDIGGTNVTSTAAELNLVDGITAGTVSASLAVIADSNKDISGFRNVTLTGELDAATLDISGNADIAGTTNLDAVDIDGAVQLDATLTVGEDDTGYDVKFFGATSGAYMLWDESTDDLVLAGAAKLYLYDAAGGENLSSDGTDLTINAGTDLNLTAGTDINIPANVGLTFGNDGEKIEGDGTDLTISGNNINLTATADVVIPANVGVTFGSGEKIEGDSTDLTITSGAKINLTATSDVHIPNNVGIVFGGDSEKIEGDGTDMTISANNLTVDAAADIILDAAGNNLIFKSDGTSILDIANNSSDVELTVSVADKNFAIKGTDGSSAITALDIDMAAAGKATFNGEVVVGGNLTVNGTTTTVNSTTMTVDDPIITLGGDSAPGSDDNKDRGVEFRYHDGSAARIGFMGFDDSATAFTFLTAASNSSEVFSGTAAKLVAGELDISGDVAVGDDLSLDSDAAVLNFGADSDVNLTHVADTGLLLNAAMVIQFRDSGLTIGSNADGDLDIVSDGTAVDSINIESAGGITLDAGTAGSGVIYEDDGTEMLRIHNSSSDVIVESKVSDKDIIFKVNDGGSSTEVARIDGDVSAFLMASGKELRFADSGEKISGDGTDLTLNSGADINLTATADINVPANVGITFGDDAEKIEGDGTDLTVTGNNIKLTATADVVVPANVGITFGTGEKIEGNNTDLTITSGAEIALTATADVNVPANVGITFGDDGEKIEGDGTDLTIASSGVINLAAGGTTNQIKVTDGAILPITDDDVDLGSASYQFKNAFFDGTLEADAITIGGSAVTAGGASTADATALAIALG